jgi:hypothetical protein
VDVQGAAGDDLGGALDAETDLGAVVVPFFWCYFLVFFSVFFRGVGEREARRRGA